MGAERFCRASRGPRKWLVPAALGAVAGELHHLLSAARAGYRSEPPRATLARALYQAHVRRAELQPLIGWSLGDVAAQQR
ncbi:MAG TPA: hypothetical protein VMW56_02965 [Candidatus Margulisiibacteriota bacterium]|nr:hypothetical protein [Candidatus Margulisiibacteriota bacterium]